MSGTSAPRLSGDVLRTRILLVATDQGKMLTDIIAELIDRSPDLEVGGAVTDERRLAEQALEAGADVVVIAGRREAIATEVARLFDVLPEIRLITINSEGSEAFIYRLEPTVRPLGELSPPQLVGAIRSAVRGQSSLALVRGAGS
jgi:DNA-binding NarL/FixJ family response regulator